MLMSLGMFLFSIPTLAHDELQRKMDWRHARTNRFGAADATQFVGPGDETVSVSGSAFAELSKGAASLDQLREMASNGEAWPLVDGTGQVFGAYVITAIDERRSYFFPDGTPRKIDFGIDLLAVDAPAAPGSGLR
ncbi:MAG TPA: phage tail protein [Allosphingosinicella sp.]|jgi:hypothetical protein